MSAEMGRIPIYPSHRRVYSDPLFQPQCPPFQSRMERPRILFLTSPEHGQANVQLAVIASLKKQHAHEVDIFLASYEEFRPRVPQGAAFKPIHGRGMTSYLKPTNNDGGPLRETVQHITGAPGFFGALSAIRNVMGIIHPETPEDYVKTVQSLEALIDELKPTLAVVDSFLDPARDAVISKCLPHVLLNPNTLKEMALADQGLCAFTFPAPCTGYPWPLPLAAVLPNTLALLYSALHLPLLDANHRAKHAARAAAGYTWPIPLIGPRSGPALCVSHRHLDWPFKVPEDVLPCGPILQDSLPLEETDRGLDAWVCGGERKTVLVGLGSIVRLDEGDARAVLEACGALLRAREDVQVLRTGRVVAFVSHGGSNSYHEALAVGVPQVILAKWYDCFDFGNRAEWLGIGRWGNKSVAPKINAAELTEALLTVVGADPEASNAQEFQRRARDIADVVAGRRKAEHNKHSRRVEVDEETRVESAKEGRDVAADFIWERVEDVIKNRN